MKRGKKYVEAAKLVDRTATYSAEEAVALVKKASTAKFDETVEAHIRTGCDGRHAEQQIRGAVVLPHGTGKTVRVLVFAKGAKATEAEAAGADGLLVVTPYYNKATQSGLIAHFTKAAGSVKIPIILYNVPSRTGCNILPATAAKLFKEVDNIVGIKEASGNLSQVAELAALTEGRMDIYSGNDDQIVPIMSLGGKGVISVLSNVAPKVAHDIPTLFLNGDVKKACELQLKSIELIKALFVEVNPIPVKHALNLMGFEVGPLRGPLSPMEPKNLEVLKNAMKNFGLI